MVDHLGMRRISPRLEHFYDSQQCIRNRLCFLKRTADREMPPDFSEIMFRPLGERRFDEDHSRATNAVFDRISPKGATGKSLIILNPWLSLNLKVASSNLAPATNDTCDVGAGDPEGSPFAFWDTPRTDRAFRPPSDSGDSRLLKTPGFGRNSEVLLSAASCRIAARSPRNTIASSLASGTRVT
jgi:hypothetical protein